MTISEHFPIGHFQQQVDLLMSQQLRKDYTQVGGTIYYVILKVTEFCHFMHPQQFIVSFSNL